MPYKKGPSKRRIHFLTQSITNEFRRKKSLMITTCIPVGGSSSDIAYHAMGIKWAT